jgi:hypothetical protein
MAETRISIPKISVRYVGLPLCEVAYSTCDIPSEVLEISSEMCRAAGDAVEGGCIATFWGDLLLLSS